MMRTNVLCELYVNNKEREHITYNFTSLFQVKYYECFYNVYGTVRLYDDNLIQLKTEEFFLA